MAKGTNKAIESVPPVNFWDVVENHLPGFHTRQDVAEDNDLCSRMDGAGDPLTAEDKKKLSALDRALYEEALLVCAGNL